MASAFYNSAPLQQRETFAMSGEMEGLRLMAIDCASTGAARKIPRVTPGSAKMFAWMNASVLTCDD